ncbi:monooxygenase [Polyangium jinanense]|uniref:Monooxygenase n=1 Tax=Polyangium jinanense TaxID=2829994 RepID=A0A9X4AYU4_9BACT|nr:monooxygenase [Polyangium jinanense]MDC3959258.1 monooxygenase [Polyangium jinanense]MDC3987650.1 monooxygenase [Polyangium jinanense]
MVTDTDVVIVGAGPVGLMLACELALARVRVRVLEQRTARMEQSRALTLHPRSLEILDQRGIVGRFLERGIPIPTGHFAMLDTRLDFSRLDTGHPYTLFLPQARSEELLEARARELGAEILRGHAVVEVTEREGSVALRVEGPEGLRDERASYAVGCDGAASVVRRSVGIAFPGSETTLTAFLGDVEVAEHPARPGSRVGPHGGVMVVPLGDGGYRFVVFDPQRMHADRSEPVTLDELRSSVQRILGTDFGMRDPRWLSRFGNATRLSERYRRGRVFLAGDAAHIHFPAGGQGLNVGLQDAMNLGWKLAAAVKGWAPPHLLDSYHEERHPVGRALSRNTEAQTRLMDVSDPGLALREIMNDLLGIEAVNRRLAGQISALDIAYPPAAGAAAHAWVGKRAPDRALESGRGATRLYELLHAGRYVLLDFADDAELQTTSEAWRDRVDVIQAKVAAPQTDLSAIDALLVRPDGHVAWASDGERRATRLDDLRAALMHWCGPA